MTSLVLLGHGSPTDEEVNRPVYDHAERLRETNAFRTVREAFLKTEPGFESVMDSVETEPVVVVPLFLTEGYYVSEVIPRKLEPYLEKKDVRYAAPIGTHRSIVDIVLSSVGSETEDVEKPVLAIVGHGSERHAGSTTAIREHAARIRRLRAFEKVRSFFLEEPPYIDSLPRVCDGDRIFVVPMFVGEGHHVREDIPEKLGLSEGSEGNSSIVYTSPAGSDPQVAEIALERAKDALSSKSEQPAHSETVSKTRGG